MSNYGTRAYVNLRHNASYKVYMGWAGVAAEDNQFICQSIITPKNGNFIYANRGAGEDVVLYFNLLGTGIDSHDDSRVKTFDPTFPSGTIYLHLSSTTGHVRANLFGFYSYKNDPSDWFWHKVTISDGADINNGTSKTLSIQADQHSPITNARMDISVGSLIGNNTKDVTVDFYRNI